MGFEIQPEFLTVAEVGESCSDPNFWGQLQIDYQAGQPVVVRKIETTKLTNDEDNNRYGTQRSK
jgi:hypothetical protein